MLLPELLEHRRQLEGVEGLGDHAQRAEAVEALDVRGGDLAREEHHRRLEAAAAQPLQRLDAVQLRHDDVEQQQVGGEGGAALDRLLARGAHVEREAAQLAEGHRGDRPRRRLVLDEQDLAQGLQARPYWRTSFLSTIFTLSPIL
jgi:hypothetical protein